MPVELDKAQEEPKHGAVPSEDCKQSCIAHNRHVEKGGPSGRNIGRPGFVQHGGGRGGGSEVGSEVGRGEDWEGGRGREAGGERGRVHVRVRGLGSREEELGGMPSRREGWRGREWWREGRMRDEEEEN